MEIVWLVIVFLESIREVSTASATAVMPTLPGPITILEEAARVPSIWYPRNRLFPTVIGH